MSGNRDDRARLKTDKEPDRRYFAVMFDTIGTIRMKIKTADDYSVGYRFRPQLRITRPEANRAIIEALGSYCDTQDVTYRIEERESRGSVQLIIGGIDNTETLLTDLRPDMIQQADAVDIMLDEILPALRSRVHSSKEGVLELMQSVDQLRETLRSDEHLKYDRAYFESEWKSELED